MQLDIAAYGWQHEHWATLYPPGMPEEWYLDFYANEFLAIVLPAALLEATDNERLQGWFADAPERFRFYWELNGVEQARRLREYLQQYGRPDTLAGYLWRGEAEDNESLRALHGSLPGSDLPRSLSVLELEAAPDLKALKQQIQQWQQAGREQCLVVIHPYAGAVQGLHQLQTLGILLNG